MIHKSIVFLIRLNVHVALAEHAYPLCRPIIAQSLPAMNPKKLLILKCLDKNALLIRELSLRRIKERYKGTLFGLTWIVGQPLFMLSVYTFVFTTIFKSRWAGMETGGELAYALNMFIGLIVFNLFNECMCSSAGIIRSNPNFVKKVIFPLEVMGISIVTGAIVQAIVSIGIWISCTSWVGVYTLDSDLSANSYISDDCCLFCFIMDYVRNRCVF